MDWSPLEISDNFQKSMTLPFVMMGSGVRFSSAAPSLRQSLGTDRNKINISYENKHSALAGILKAIWFIMGRAGISRKFKGAFLHEVRPGLIPLIMAAYR